VSTESLVMTSKVELRSGNEAIARGAYEAGVTVATGYPGTPSTEILEALSQFKPEIYCEWSPNEKVALEVAVGASFTGARSMVTMKHVGLNVAADPLMTFASIGAVGGLVICVADDSGMHSSQNEQDTCHYARFAQIPIFEPSDSEEARDFTALALQVSEQFQTPVILGSTTRVSHSRSDQKQSLQCLECLGLGCPALEHDEAQGLPINDLLCGGCQMCRQICRSNLVILGALSTDLALPVQAWREGIRQSVKPKFVDLNLRAFAAGAALKSQ